MGNPFGNFPGTPLESFWVTFNSLMAKVKTFRSQFYEKSRNPIDFENCIAFLYANSNIAGFERKNAQSQAKRVFNPKRFKFWAVLRKIEQD